MHTYDMLNEILSQKKHVIKHGKLNENILLELKMTTSLYDYIRVVTNHYSDEERPDFINWTDVEGMGYGWRWLRYEEKEERWHEMMAKMVREEAEYLSKNRKEQYFVVYDEEDTKTYHFITNEYTRTDILISFSNKELSY